MKCFRYSFWQMLTLYDEVVELTKRLLIEKIAQFIIEQKMYNQHVLNN